MQDMHIEGLKMLNGAVGSDRGTIAVRLRRVSAPGVKPNGSCTITQRGSLFPGAANALSLNRCETVEASLLLAKPLPERL